MAEVRKLDISLSIGEVKKIALAINPSDEENFRKAEKLVNQIWTKWRDKFGDRTSSEEVMARVAFQFARLYVEASERNEKASKLLGDFETKLDDIVVKI
jgi:hypothetical protein